MLISELIQFLEYVASLREEQKEQPAPLVLRSKINDLAGELYNDGYTCLEISKLLSMGKCTVYRVLRWENIFEKQDRSIAKEVEENVVRIYKKGQEAREISELLAITIPSVRWILKKNKIPPHRTRVSLGKFPRILKEKNIPLKGRRQSAIDKQLQEKAI